MTIYNCSHYYSMPGNLCIVTSEETNIIDHSRITSGMRARNQIIVYGKLQTGLISQKIIVIFKRKYISVLSSVNLLFYRLNFHVVAGFKTYKHKKLPTSTFIICRCDYSLIRRTHDYAVIKGGQQSSSNEGRGGDRARDNGTYVVMALD